MTEDKKSLDNTDPQNTAEPEIEAGEVVEEEVVEGAKVRRKGIYLLPQCADHGIFVFRVLCHCVRCQRCF